MRVYKRSVLFSLIAFLDLSSVATSLLACTTINTSRCAALSLRSYPRLLASECTANTLRYGPKRGLRLGQLSSKHPALSMTSTTNAVARLSTYTYGLGWRNSISRTWFHPNELRGVQSLRGGSGHGIQMSITTPDTTHTSLATGNHQIRNTNESERDSPLRAIMSAHDVSALIIPSEEPRIYWWCARSKMFVRSGVAIRWILLGLTPHVDTHPDESDQHGSHDT